MADNLAQFELLFLMKDDPLRHFVSTWHAWSQYLSIITVMCRLMAYQYTVTYGMDGSLSTKRIAYVLGSKIQLKKRPAFYQL